MISQGDWLTETPAEDVVVNTVRFDHEFYHAGGFTSFGNYLAIGSEKGCTANERMTGQCVDESKVHFFDAANATGPAPLPYSVDRPTGSAGAVAITQEQDGRFLMMVGRTDSNILDFYRSKGTSLATDPGFELFTTWYKESLLVDAGVSSAYEKYQTLNFIRQTDGKLFMIGMSRTVFGLGNDMADLFEVDASHSKSVTIKKVASRHMSCPEGTCNFEAGAGVYVESPTAMLIYASNWEPAGDTIMVNEFRGQSEGVSGQGIRNTGVDCSGGQCDGPAKCFMGRCFCSWGHEVAGSGDGTCVKSAR